MKIRNKLTGEIIDIDKGEIILYYNQGRKTIHFKYLEDLEDWEDYEEPKEYWIIYGDRVLKNEVDDVPADRYKEIGNYFSSREEAEQAVRKLEAWKLLKDMGFKIKGIRYRDNKSYIEWSISQKTRDDHFMSEAFNEALHLLFGGEE